MALRRKAFHNLRLFVFLVILGIATGSAISAFAQESAKNELAAVEHQTLYGVLEFSEVEWVARNHNIGLYRGSSLKLSPWIDVESSNSNGDSELPGAVVGIDGTGQVVQVVPLKDRVLAIPLSANHSFVDLFLVNGFTLVAVDKGGSFFVFDWNRWRDRGRFDRVKKWVQRGFGTGAVALVSLLGTGAVLGWNTEGVQESIWVTSLAFSGLSFSSLFWLTHEYENSNQNPDGFKSLDFKIEGYRRSHWENPSSLLGFEVSAVDRLGRLQNLSDFFASLPQGPFENFQRKCEHQLLARGIPESAYNP